MVLARLRSCIRMPVLENLEGESQAQQCISNRGLDKKTLGRHFGRACQLQSLLAAVAPATSRQLLCNRFGDDRVWQWIRRFNAVISTPYRIFSTPTSSRSGYIGGSCVGSSSGGSSGPGPGPVRGSVVRDLLGGIGSLGLSWISPYGGERRIKHCGQAASQCVASDAASSAAALCRCPFTLATSRK